MSCDWDEVVIKDVIEFNPKESLKKGQLAKKIAMDELQPFTKKISGFAKECFTGGAKFRNGDTLLARITPCLENGKTAFVDILDQDEIAFGSTEFLVMRAKPGKTDSKFVYYLATSPNFRSLAIQSMTGTSGRQRVQNGLVENAVICIPPLDEQFSIAETLSCLDDKIELNNRINKTLEEMAQAIFKQWFVDFEFPDENGQPYKSSGGEMEESELGLIPKGWKVESLKDIAKDIICGKTPSTANKEYYGGDIPFITIPDMHGNVFVISTERYLSKEGVNAQPNKTLPPFSICVSCIATPGLVVLTDKESQANQQINSLICKDDISPYYVYLSLTRLADHIRTLGSGGSTTLNLNKTEFSKIKVIVPSKNEIDKFHSTVTSVFELIRNNQKEKRKLESIRDSLLPKLMSGEIRIPVEEVPQSV